MVKIELKILRGEEYQTKLDNYLTWSALRQSLARQAIEPAKWLEADLLQRVAQGM
jgi:hypothetical protein